jgi:hypothetical protein
LLNNYFLDRNAIFNQCHAFIVNSILRFFSPGQLFAGATAGGDVKAAAGLGGAVANGDRPQTIGGLFSAASAGGARAGSSLAGGVADGVSYKVVEKVADTPVKVVKREDDASKMVHYVRGHPVRFDRFFTEELADVSSSKKVDTTTRASIRDFRSETIKAQVVVTEVPKVQSTPKKVESLVEEIPTIRPVVVEIDDPKVEILATVRPRVVNTERTTVPNVPILVTREVIGLLAVKPLKSSD